MNEVIAKVVCTFAGASCGALAVLVFTALLCGC